MPVCTALVRHKTGEATPLPRDVPACLWLRGLGPAGLQSVLQALCFTARSSFDVIEDWVEATLLLPDPRLSEAVCPFTECTLSTTIMHAETYLHI